MPSVDTRKRRRSPAAQHGDSDEPLAREALDSDDADTMKGAFDALTAASHKLAEVMYSEGGGAPGAAPGAGAPESDASGDDDGDVIDAEYEDA